MSDAMKQGSADEHGHTEHEHSVQCEVEDNASAYEGSEEVIMLQPSAVRMRPVGMR